MRPRGAEKRSHTVRRGKILYSLILLMLITGLVPLAATSFRLVTKNREALETAEKLTQVEQTRSVAAQSLLYLRSTHERVEAIAQAFEFGGDPRLIRARIESVSDGQGLDTFAQGGNLLYLGVLNREGVGGDVGLRFDDDQLVAFLHQSFAEALSGHTWVSPPYVFEPWLQTVVFISAPIQSEAAGDMSGPVEGVVTALVGLSPVQDYIVDVHEKTAREVYIVDRAGRLVAHSDPKTLFERVDLSKTAIVRTFQESRGQASGSVNFDLSRDGETQGMLGSYAPVGDRFSSVPFLRDLGWGVIVQAEEDAVYTASRTILWESVGIAALAAAFSFVFAIVFARQLSSPIAQLANGARQLASGDFSQNITVRSGNEIGELADTFNFMILEIRQFIERLRKAAEENKQMFTGAVSSLAAAIDAKDPYTAGHSERVAHYSATIAKILKFPEDEIEIIRLSALMHDVGKIGIQDAILGKAGPLTDEEFAIMKTHPTKGAVIMEKVPQLKAMIPGLKYHHENVDGSGYPEGLLGDEIPVMAKIVSVADTFDAMTTNRPYQKAMEISYVFNRMRSFIGKKFEAHIVEALIKGYEEGLIRPEVPVKAQAKPAPPIEGDRKRPGLEAAAPTLRPAQGAGEAKGVGPAPALMNKLS